MAWRRPLELWVRGSNGSNGSTAVTAHLGVVGPRQRCDLKQVAGDTRLAQLHMHILLERGGEVLVELEPLLEHEARDGLQQ